jgi:small acid-soluble spore protein H (minor)
MDMNRAQQIIDAPGKINVTLNGQSVWIDSVDASSGMANVHPEQNPQDTQKVSVNQLQEA